MTGQNKPQANDLLTFKRPISLDGLGRALKAYQQLILALEGREPTYTDFTSYLAREGYVDGTPETAVAN